MEKDKHNDDEIKKIFQMNDIAVVGMSKNEEKPAHFVPKYLISQGYNIIPVNPTTNMILNKKSYSSVSEIEQNVHVVEIFRKSEDVLDVVQDVVKKNGIKLIWMQEGIYNREAELLAKKYGIDVVYNRCMMEEHRRLFGNI